MAADWSSLHADLVQRVSDCLLDTNDIDYYMDMRAVCRDWRSAIPKPSPLGVGAGDDLRFRPRKWVMLDEELDGDDRTRFFLNVSTGRFLRQRLPLLQRHILVGTSEGLLILARRDYPYAACVINPFTGSTLHFAAGVVPEKVNAAATASSPMLLFLFEFSFSSEWSEGDEVWCATPSARDFKMQFLKKLDQPYIASTVAYEGHVYMADRDGTVIKSDGTVRYCDDDGGHVSADTSQVIAKPDERPHGSFLVESGADLLLVRRLETGAMKVFAVDGERKALEPVKSLGSRALFLGDRCLCVDAAKLPSIDGNCIYHTNGSRRFDFSMYKYDLGDGGEEMIKSEDSWMPYRHSFPARPFSLERVLLTYCVDLPDVEAQLNYLPLP